LSPHAGIGRVRWGKGHGIKGQMVFLDRVRTILFAPHAAWPAIAREHTAMSSLAVHVAALAAIPAAARFIGVALIGVAAPNGAVVRIPVPVGLLDALVEYALAVIAVPVVALVANVLAPWFGGQRSLQNAFKLSAYSFTPYWLAGVFMLFPGLKFLAALGLYGFYLAWSGLPHLMRSPADKSLGYAVALLASALALMFLAVKATDSLLLALRLA
jgi:hypothetical protein